jgi:small subunit ribosomal protein S14
MAKTSAIHRNIKRQKITERDANKRARLKAIARDRSLPPEERFQASLKLAELPRNGSRVRIRNRCLESGRPRGFYRKFKLSRIALRDLASVGQIPGMVKSSW